MVLRYAYCIQAHLLDLSLIAAVLAYKLLLCPVNADGYSTEILYFHWHWDDVTAFDLAENLELPNFHIANRSKLECVDTYSMGKLSPVI